MYDESKALHLKLCDHGTGTMAGAIVSDTSIICPNKIKLIK
jgi:hypothetical protein